MSSRKLSLDHLAQVVCDAFTFLTRSSDRLADNSFLFFFVEYKRALGVASLGVKKKVYNTFVQTYFEHWITVLNENPVESLRSSILAVGVETLLSVDVLRFTACHLPLSSQGDSMSKQVHLLDRLEVLLNDNERVLNFLPIFYASYVHALYQYPTQLFSQVQSLGGASARDGYRKSVCAFLARILRLIDRVEGPMLLVWRTRVELLRVLFREGGYLGSVDDGDEVEGEDNRPGEMLRHIIRRAVAVLDHTGPLSPSLKPPAVQSLSIIIRIDYDIVKPFVPQILESILVLTLGDNEGEREAYIEFLDLLLECHVKTRTIDELVGIMLRGIQKGSLSRGMTRRVEGREGMVIEDVPFLESIGKAVRSFGTVGQCVALIECVREFIEWGLRALERVERKTQSQVEEDVDMEEDQGEDMGLRLQLGAKVVCVVLAFLPFEMLSEGERNERLEVLKSLKRGVDGVVGRLVGQLGLREGMQCKEELECGLSALLRVKYVFDRNVFGGRGLGINLGMDEDEALKGLVRFLECKLEEDENEGGLPELTVDVARTVFLYISTKSRQLGPSASVVGKGKGKDKGKATDVKSLNKEANDERFFSTLLAFVELHYPRTKTDTGWSGLDHDLSARGKEGKTKCAISLVCMIVERWLGEVDSLATPSHIRKFLDIILGVGGDLGGKEKKKTGLINPERILLNMLHSAWFWEFGRIRKELIELLKERTSPLSPNQMESAGLWDRISTFNILLYFPLEYFSFQVLNGFFGCAVGVDGCLAEMWKRSGWEKEEVMRGLVVLRVFVRRVCVHVGGGLLDFRGKNEAELLLRMMEEPILVDDGSCVGQGVKQEYLTASLDLAEVWLMRLLKTSKKTNDPVALLQVLKRFNLDSTCGRGRGQQPTLTSKCFIRMVELLDKEGLGQSNTGAVHEEVWRTLRVLRDELVGGLYGRILKEVSREGLENAGQVGEYVELVRLWDGLICLGRWISNFGLGELVGGDEHPQFIADKLVSVLMPHVQLRDVLDGRLEEFCVGVFSVLLGEIECRNMNRNDPNGGDDEARRRSKYLEVMLAVYVSFGNKISVPGLKAMDVRIGRTAKRLSVYDFEHLLSSIAESLADTDLGQSASKSRSSRLTQLVHVGSLLVHDHPSHSLACIQKFMARCLCLFNDNPLYVEGDPTLRLGVLEMVGQYCSDQQAALRARDTSPIWLLVAKILAPSQEHDLETQKEIFHKIVSILMCLIRLRRDLVALGLPHLGLILRKLVLALRGCRPNLGAKQMAVVMNTQPRWISHVHSLGGDEAKALSRLLESLTAKTTVRLYFSADALNPQKAESLAKPFSKHAAYVLKAYVEAMNDPLCVMSLEVRKEMKEGLFALCGMMGVHSRDALMVGGGLDVGGKAVLKAVWKEWEEVRYVGKG